MRRTWSKQSIYWLFLRVSSFVVEVPVFLEKRFLTKLWTSFVTRVLFIYLLEEIWIRIFSYISHRFPVVSVNLIHVLIEPHSLSLSLALSLWNSIDLCSLHDHLLVIKITNNFFIFLIVGLVEDWLCLSHHLNAWIHFLSDLSYPILLHCVLLLSVWKRIMIWVKSLLSVVGIKFFFEKLIIVLVSVSLLLLWTQPMWLRLHFLIGL